MIHLEFTLTVKQEIFEIVSPTLQSAVFKVGDKMNIDESTFISLQKNNIIERFGRTGIIRFDKNNFENEVECTSITIERSIRKLGQRKTK
jgi:hypothetical protein